MPRPIALLFLVGLVVLPACGPSGPATYPVSGTVSYQGAAVENGLISFTNLDGKQNPASGEIRNGKYSLQAEPGIKKVEIRANREGPVDPVMGAKTSVPYIPPTYNDSSELKATVTEDAAKNVFDFKLD